jgi:hypothetical protein
MPRDNTPTNARTLSAKLRRIYAEVMAISSPFPEPDPPPPSAPHAASNTIRPEQAEQPELPATGTK